MENPYKRVVPKSYHRVAGLDRYVPNLVELPRGAVHFLCREGIEPRPIGTSAHCQWRNDGHIFGVLVPQAASPALFEAIIQLGEAVITGVRLQRFSGAFKAYECLAKQPDIDLAAIRHAISHPESVLSRPKTVEALRRLFGGTQIDLDRPEHRSVYYRELGRLLMTVDTVISEALAAPNRPWLQVPRGFRPAHQAYVRRWGAV